MRARAWSVLPFVVTTLLLLFGANPASAGAKNDFTYFAEATFLTTDAEGIETLVIMTGIDHVNTPDEVALEINRSNPACADPSAGCQFVLFSGFVRLPVAERDVRVQPNLYWAHVITTMPFVDNVSGTTCAATIDLSWRSTSEFFPEGDNGQGFRKADASGTVTCGGEEFTSGQVDSGAEISRFILTG